MQLTKKDIKQVKTWVKALRSGKYAQTVGALQDEKGFCCLGVACDVTIPRKELDLHNGVINGGMIQGYQKAAPSWLRYVNIDFKNQAGINLSILNDEGTDLNGNSLDDIALLDGLGSLGGLTYNFDEIADLIEAVYILKVLD